MCLSVCEADVSLCPHRAGSQLLWNIACARVACVLVLDVDIRFDCNLGVLLIVEVFCVLIRTLVGVRIIVTASTWLQRMKDFNVPTGRKTDLLLVHAIYECNKYIIWNGSDSAIDVDEVIDSYDVNYVHFVRVVWHGICLILFFSRCREAENSKIKRTTNGVLELGGILVRIMMMNLLVIGCRWMLKGGSTGGVCAQNRFGEVMSCVFLCVCSCDGCATFYYCSTNG